MRTLNASDLQAAAQFETLHITTVDLDELPEDWRTYPALEALRQIGDRWAAERTTPVLQVPSAVVPGEASFLLNPLHPEFQELKLDPPTALSLDLRLAKG